MTAVRWVRRPRLRNPQAVCAFAGWGDAGDSSTGAAHHLIAALEGDAFADIDPDDFYEFQARRPEVQFESGVRSVYWPDNEFHALHHADGDLVVLVGEEPHLRWRAFTEEIAATLVDLEVSRVVLLGAFLGQVAHSRPVPLVGAASDISLLTDHEVGISAYEGPTGIVGVLTQALAEHGLEAMSVWAAVPHYLSNQTYPPGIHALVRKATQILGLPLELAELAAAAAEFRFSVDAVVADNEELVKYIEKLEQSESSEVRRSPDPVDGLVEEIERFLEER